MNYELAKQLKDTGFLKQTIVIGDRYFGKNLDTGEMFLTYVEESDLRIENWEKFIAQDLIFVPLLHELIEMCGKNLHCLVQTDRTEDGKNIFWSAGTDNKVINWHNASKPDEAVVLLLLSLNKK